MGSGDPRPGAARIVSAMRRVVVGVTLGVAAFAVAVAVLAWSLGDRAEATPAPDDPPRAVPATRPATVLQSVALHRAPGARRSSTSSARTRSWRASASW